MATWRRGTGREADGTGPRRRDVGGDGQRQRAARERRWNVMVTAARGGATARGGDSSAGREAAAAERGDGDGDGPRRRGARGRLGAVWQRRGKG
uniref:Uncharacterized protein B1642C07.51 n=1 Tax=Oryza sativa subsp. japonica TaxID=39947 RepID=Q5F1X4_ORYSJ|nr:hypothetical protein [Oryza sativa Japonica Group]